jgi:hypothetical protein
MRTRNLRQRNTVTGALAALLFAATSLPVSARPITYDDVTGTAKWKVPITIYIPRDPRATGTIHDEIKRAVDEWAKIAAGKNITLTPVILDASGNVPGTGQPPNPTAKGSVVVKYQTQGGHASPQFEGPVIRIGPKGEDILGDVEYTHGEIRIGTGAPAQAYVIALHEIGHMLGLDHEKKGTDSIMQPSVDDYERLTKPTATDTRQFNAVYARADAKLDGSAFALGPDEFQYTYTATWLSGGEIPLVQIFVAGAAISDPVIPAGWEIVGLPDTGNFVSLRIDPTNEFQAYLGSDNPLLAFSFTSSEPPTTTFGWAGSDQITQSVIGPVQIPEPPVLLIFVSGLVPLMFLTRVSCSRERRPRSR